MTTTNSKEKSLQEAAAHGQTQTVLLGERLMRPDQFSPCIYRIDDGEARLLTKSLNSDEAVTITRLRAGDWCGISSLLAGRPCEWVTSAGQLTVTGIGAEVFARMLWESPEMLSESLNLRHPALAAEAIRRWIESEARDDGEWDQRMKEILESADVIAIMPGETVPEVKEGGIQLVGSKNMAGLEIGKVLSAEDKTRVSLEPRQSQRQPFMVVEIGGSLKTTTAAKAVRTPSVVEERLNDEKDGTRLKIPDAFSLGLRDDKTARLGDKYPEKMGPPGLGSRLAVLEMLAKQTKVPFRRDQYEQYLRRLERKQKSLDLQNLASMVQGMGLMARPATIETTKIASVITPFLALNDNQPMVVYEIQGDNAIVGDGITRIRRVATKELGEQKSKLQFVLVSRLSTTPVDTFNWSWVWPVVKKYQKALYLVLIISLMAQVFALGVPLLLQQLIDKVLSQGNLSSLNTLAGLMVAFALFQGVLTALRTFLFVDTTDRIDLTLGSAVIDRLLKLPLGYYEKRPVGELSQRLGELNNIRSFLTGTAITTFLDLVFCTIYLLIMLTYSPSLTAIALSTFPVYLLLTLFAAPVYRRQLKERAKAQARTQSHLIEVIGGIQTIKAQHGELGARWKWQDRYQMFVEQSYKSIVLGTSTTQIGSFLNTLSGLLILWAGLNLVLKGEFSLGQLLAFRIFAGYVTQPLLRLSSLWQGVQKVNLSMERLGDIVNQQPEGGLIDHEQIALPPVEGSVVFQNLDFRFASQGPKQLNGVSLNVQAGEFVGIVGLSGSGKSTLMKLLVRLYEPNSGRILIDGIDIAKVQLTSLRSQLGIVPQDSLLFQGSVAENIAMNNSDADTDEIIRAAKLACAHEFIMELPDGYATKIAEKGANLSGGQRQRIAIARMILENPSLLILDEATSALDANTERSVCQNLQGEFSGKTVFYVTHRLATVLNADRVVVLDGGKVIENGRPGDLIRGNGIFAALWNQQSG